MSILGVKDLSYSYEKDTPVLQNVSFDLRERDILCLLGPNGSGKSTLMTQILFPNQKNKACIRICDRPYTVYSLRERARIIGFVSQKIPSLQLSVLQTVMMGRNPYQKSLFLKPTDEDYKIADHVIRKLGLSEYSGRKLTTLSGGEVQRVFIAQALVKNAKIYFFDEPMSALDPEYQSGFLELITNLSEQGTAVIFTTHNPNHLFALKKARAGIIRSDHSFREPDLSKPEGIQEIEEIFHGAISIEYNASRGAYAAMFQY